MSLIKSLKQKQKPLISSPATPGYSMPEPHEQDSDRAFILTLSSCVYSILFTLHVTYTSPDMSCSNLPSGTLGKYSFYAVIIVDGKSQKTISAEKATNPWWDTTLRL